MARRKLEKDEDLFVAVPIERDGSMHQSILWHVALGRDTFGEPGRFGRDPDNLRIDLVITDERAALKLAGEILEALADRPGEAIEIELQGVVTPDEFQLEPLTNEESRIVNERWTRRINEEEP